VSSGTVKIGERTITDGAPPFLIAEAGVNHNGSPEMAQRLVEAAAEAGADAIKFQTFSAEALATSDAPLAEYQKRSSSGSQLEMLRALELPKEGLRSARDRALELGIIFLSTPFDLDSVQVLADLDVPAYKVGSGDLTNLILLRAVASQGRPMIVSTGMATLPEVDAAVAAVREAGNPPLILLHCTSAYPAAPADANLRAMATLRERFGVPVGYSDHTHGLATAIAAAALGAAVIEKHMTLDRSLPGPDHAASLEPGEMADLAASLRDAYAALGDGRKLPRRDEEDTARVARRSLVVARPVQAGMVIAAADLDARRPAGGISPMRLDEVVGRRAARDLRPGALLQVEDVEPALPAAEGMAG
jgi:N,N'-diacetyllegionaminate synthase